MAAANNVLQPEFKIARIPIRNWVVENIKQFPPEIVGRYFIYGDAAGVTPPPSKIGLLIPAGGAFGSGDHGTTKGCLEALGSIKQPPAGRVLDMGCGSGILAIAMAKSWRLPVIASDIDPVAVRVAGANVRRNQVGPWVRVAHTRGYRHPAIRKTRFELVVSNILARPLVRMAGDLAKCLAPSGTAILSGLIEADGNWVLNRHRQFGMRLQRQIVINGWLTLVLTIDQPL